MNIEIARDALYGLRGEGWEFLFEQREDRGYGHGWLERYILLDNGDVYKLCDGGCSCGWVFQERKVKIEDWEKVDIDKNFLSDSYIHDEQSYYITQSGIGWAKKNKLEVNEKWQIREDE